jgi:hypothetical protein
MAFLMGVIENRSITKKFPSYVIPTVQGIMMRYPMMNGDKISSFLFDMFGLDETANPLIREWQYLATCDHNPAKPAKCEERVKIFGRWLA